MGRESRVNPLADAIRGAAEVHDCANRPLLEGDEVVLMTGRLQPYRVAQVAPVLDPGAPTGLLRVTLVSTAVFLAMRNVPNMEFGILRQVEEIAVPTTESK
jgi:hypothetical protein